MVQVPKDASDSLGSPIDFSSIDLFFPVAIIDIEAEAFKMVELPGYDVLFFCFDNDHGCSLTVLANNERYHVTVDPKQFQDRSKKGKEIQREYSRLLTKAKKAEQNEEDGDAASSSEEESDEDQDTDDTEQERDSAVDVSTPELDEKQDKRTTITEPMPALHNWILTPLAQRLPSDAAKCETSLQDWYHTPIQFYNLSTASGKLKATKDSSPPWSLRDRLNEILTPSISIPKKTLKLSIPQFSASDLTVLSCAADPAPFHPILVSHKGTEYFLKPVDATQPGPSIREIHLLHSIAKKGLHSRKDFRCPELRGLVYFPSAGPNEKCKDGEKTHIAALLLTPIPNPTPLTRLLDSAIPQHKREKWANDAGRMVEILHENDVVWGDAKGDNFLVDGEEEKVWIIDFGGSYTEGWVDEKVKETEEGDWMGTEKVVNALEDPVNGVEGEDGEKEGVEVEAEEEEEEEEELEKNSIEGEEDGENEEKSGADVPEPETEEAGPEEGTLPDDPASAAKMSARKRNHSAIEDTNDTQSSAKKQQKRSSGDETQERKYCFCNEPSSGRMLACDGKQCKREWFHFKCLGIEQAPEERVWLCEDCRN